MPSWVWLIAIILITAIVCKILDIGGKFLQLIVVVLCVIVVFWLLGVTGVWTAPGFR